MKLMTVITTCFVGDLIGFHFATAKPSKQPTPKPSCPKGLSVTWAPSSPSSIPLAQWLCCKNSDKTGDCKAGQAPFPYGPRRKLVCCQCPAGQVLNKDKNGCLPAGSLTPSLTPTTKPTSPLTVVPTTVPTAVSTSSPTAVPTPVPTAVPTSPLTAVPTTVPTAVSTSSPTAVPTPVPTAVPTSPLTAVPTTVLAAVPTSLPTSSATNPSTQSGTLAPYCDPGYELTDSLFLEEEIPPPLKYQLIQGFQMCCKPKTVGQICLLRDVRLFRYLLQQPESCCYCLPHWVWQPSVRGPPVRPGHCT